MDLSEHPTYLAVFFAVWLLAIAYGGSVFLLSAILAGERRRGERQGGPSFPPSNPLEMFEMLKFIFTASAAKGESATVMRTVWVVRVLFVISLVGILGVMGWTASYDLFRR